MAFSLTIPNYAAAHNAAAGSTASGSSRVVDPASKYLNFYATPSGEAEYAVLSHYDLSTSLQASAAGPGLQTATIVLNLSGGTYSSCRFEVLDSSDAVLTTGGSGSSFTIQIGVDNTIALGGHPANATALVVGTPLVSQNAASGGVSYYSYPVLNGRSYSLSITASSGTPDLVVFDTDGKPVTGGYVSCAALSSASFDWTAAADGTAYVCVYGYGGAADFELSAAEAPAFTVAGSGVVRTVSLASSMPGAVIYYTLDGTEPTTGSAQYSAPISFAGMYVKKTVKAFARSGSGVGSTAVSRIVAVGPSAPLSLSNTATTFATGLGGPAAVATDGTCLYVADRGNHKIFKVDSSGNATLLAGTGTAGNSDGSGATATFNEPGGITTDGVNLYVADISNNLIRKVVIATGDVTTIAGTGSYGEADNASGTLATFQNPVSVSTDGSFLYIVDGNGNSVRKYNLSTTEVTTIIANGGGLWAPSGIATDGSNLYVGDCWNNRIVKISIGTGTITTLAGSGSSGFADDASGDGSAAQFWNPQGVATDGTYVYIADTDNDAIRRIELSSGATTTIATGFYGPKGIMADADCLYVADTGNGMVRKIQ